MTADHAAADPDADPGNRAVHAEQRTWLNGFFAGLLSLDGGVNPLSADEAAALMGDVAARRRARAARRRR